MIVQSTYKYARISPSKVHDVARAIRRLPVKNAINLLRFTPKKAARLLLKTLNSAIANAENNHNLRAEQLIVLEAIANDGPAFKRYIPRARGSASPIRKRTAHIRITLTDDLNLTHPRQIQKARPQKAEQPSNSTPSVQGASAKLPQTENLLSSSEPIQTESKTEIPSQPSPQPPQKSDSPSASQSSLESTSESASESTSESTPQLSGNQKTIA
ncbi:MAG: 50S ribosomal protein L22 [Chthoniobacterales bacterium]|nr:50S ribosomal protein L22 [Chthoniobacterales bacterium]